MSSVVSDRSLPLPSPPPYPVRRFTVAEYEELTRLGFLTEDDNVELLEGWIAPKMPKHPPHDNAIDVINHLLARLLPLGWFVRIQNSVVTADSIPEPDLAIVRGKPGDYRQKHPTGADVALIIEVADTTVQRDRAKAAIYSRAGIPHYWIVNLEDQQLEVHGQVAGTGLDCAYQSRQVLRGDEPLTVVLDGQAVGTLVARDLLA